MVVERLLQGLLLAVVVLAGGAATAQGNATPQTGDMIEALKPPLTRGSRNLLVRPKPDEAASAPTAMPVALPTTPPAAQPLAAATEPAPSLSLSIQFDTNSSRVRPESGGVLGNLVAALQSPELKPNRFVIEGHTDASGNPAANQRLSQQRAEEVRLYLVALGVHPARLRAVGKGSSEPADPLNPLSADNRRVRVVTLP